MSNEVPTVVDDSATERALRDLLDQTGDPLEPVEPERAVELYLEDRERDCRQSTVASHRSRLGFFVDWCDHRDIDNMNDLSARDLHEYRVWRRQDLNVSSESTQMATMRVFIEWCETIDAVPAGLFKKLNVPTVPDEEKARERMIHLDRAEEILDFLTQFEYATVEHVVWSILTETGMRMGSAHTLDVDDYCPNAEVPHLDIVHRPDTGTPIKNGPRGERPVAIPESVCNVIDDYMAHQRPDVTDDSGRKPLLATAQERPAKSTIRKYVYKWSRPCAYGKECPHDRNPEECEAASDVSQASKCPSSVTLHPIRRGYITHLLQSGVPVEVVSDRCNVTPGVIDQHYDVRSEEDKMRQRQQVLTEAQSGDASIE